MSEHFQILDASRIKSAAASELDYIRRLGSNDDLVMATANLGAYEALLYVLSGYENGTPVYQILANVKSRYSTQSGIISRLRAMRQLGLIEARPGTKKSQVCLAPSEKLLKDLGPILLRRFGAAP